MKNKIDHIGLWTWGGRVFNWKRYLDHMRLSGMDSVVLWHQKVPFDARTIQDYAHQLGIRVLWGFNWSWNSPVCLNSEHDAAEWRDKVLKIVNDEYAPLSPDGICFQVGGTEFGGSCRLNCPTCQQAGKDGVGPLFVKFAGHIIEAVKKVYPDLYVSAGIHLGGVHKSFETLKTFDPSINLMWEDLPGPGRHIEVPFAYEWDTDDTAVTPTTLDMVKRMCELRGEQEDVAFVIKGFPCHWGGHDPMLLEEFDLKALATVYQNKWDQASLYCEKRLSDALTVFRIIAQSPAQNKTVLLLVEHGLWEYKRYYPAMLIVEALLDPFREPNEIISVTRKKIVSLW
ncbi:MAG: hypothetical protein WC975_04565 [Phycisphaerae bacterium]